MINITLKDGKEARRWLRNFTIERDIIYIYEHENLANSTISFQSDGHVYQLIIPSAISDGLKDYIGKRFDVYEGLIEQINL